MSASSAQSGLQALIELARRDRVELRPTLLRVLVDQFVQEPAHRPLDKARFSELACRLLDNVDVSTRAVVAQRLAAYAGTPGVVASRLARDEIAVAEPILRQSATLGEAELHAILDSCGIGHAIAIKMRGNLPESVARRLGSVGKGTDAAPRAQRIDRSGDGPALTLALARRYLATETDERKLILQALPACPAVEPEERIRRIDRKFGEQLERAALRHQSQEFAVLLRRAAGVPGDLAARIVADPAGDPLLVVCRALEIQFGATSRILLFLNPKLGASVQQVFALAEWFEEIRPAAARRLLGAWCALAPAHAQRTSATGRGVRERADMRASARPGMPSADRLPARRTASEP
ncbi:MAG: hypothetical protein IT539_03945 [Bradyrhizobiaceae bacterium]|nr:hypothetical protein [Bradyrhizobiaceae bacterium]